MLKVSKSLELARVFLGKTVTVTIDRPLFSKHPKWDFVYEANYGYIPNTLAPDGAELDAYFLGVDKPLEKATGVCIAIVHRLNDDDDKLVVVPETIEMSDEAILEAVHFQEQFFDHVLVKA
jgi:inorganic pyrophosphatase